MVKLRGFLLGIVFAAVAVGFAAAMPGAMSVPEVDTTDESVEERDTAAEADARRPTPRPDESSVDSDESRKQKDPSSDDGASRDNHGSAVSAVAKCDVKGRWHGEAVRSIAQNKDATLADAEAACAAAEAAAAAAGGPGKSAAAKSKAGKATASADKPAKAPKADKPSKPAAPPAEVNEAPAEQPSSDSGSGSSGSGSSGSSSSGGSGGPPTGKGKP